MSWRRSLISPRMSKKVGSPLAYHRPDLRLINHQSWCYLDIQRKETWTSYGQGLSSTFLPILIPNQCVFSCKEGLKIILAIAVSSFILLSIWRGFLKCQPIPWMHINSLNQNLFSLELGFCSWKGAFIDLWGNSLFGMSMKTLSSGRGRGIDRCGLVI